MSTANLSRAEAAARSAAVTLHSYTVELDLSSAADLHAPTFPTRTVAVMTSGEAHTFLDFIGPRVHRVVVDGEVRDVDFDGNRITVPGLRTDGRRSTVEVHGEAAYSRSGEGLHRFRDPVDGETYLYTQYEPADARRVFACFEQPDLKAPMTFVVTAPQDWHVLSNTAAEVVSPAVDGARTWRFAPTLPLATYISAVLAGPYHRVESSWQSADGEVEVPLGLWCRRSLAPYLDADELFTLTAQGLDFFHEVFAYPYPWGKYDQVFVPEYNLGAMENPGCVTFNEHYVFRSPATEAQREGRATTLMHEMSHMWFGDLVTMRWWDDLWLKESFADFMGSYALVQATRFDEAWTTFARRRKAWAYAQDQRPTTHPIVADIVDLEAAKQNFDGITYAKGAAVLKQLVAFVGEEAFLAGAREYFATHAYGSTTLPDLLVALEEASGRELGDWSRDWLQSAGPSRLRADLRTARGPHGETITGLRVTQQATDPTTGEPALREHRLAVGLYDTGADGRLHRSHRFSVELSDTGTDVPEAVGLPAPDLLVVNDDDLTYALVDLDDRTLAAALARVSDIAESLPRALVWSALWNATRDAHLPAASFLAAVAHHAPREADAGMLRDVLGNADEALTHYVRAGGRAHGRRTHLGAVWQALHGAEPGSDRQLVLARHFATVAGADAGVAPHVRELLEGTLPGLELSPDLRWLMWTALAVGGQTSTDELSAELTRERTATTELAHLRAVSSMPTAAAKAAGWQRLGLGAGPGEELTNSQVDAIIAGFAQPHHEDLLAAYVEPYFQRLTTIWHEHSIEIAERLVYGLFPSWVRPARGAEIEDHPAVSAAETWLARHPAAPAALRRCVVEEIDDLRRALRCQQEG